MDESRMDVSNQRKHFKNNVHRPDWHNAWSTVVLSWVNSFQKGCDKYSRFNSISQFDDIQNIIEKILTSDQKSVKTSQCFEELADFFLKEYFPSVFISTSFSYTNEEDYLILVTLTMLAFCLKVQIKEITYQSEIHIDPCNQEIMVKFFQQIMNMKDKNLTRNAIINAVQQSLGSSNSHTMVSFSPISSRNNVLQEFLDSPALQDRKDKDRMLLTLKALLNDEQNEKADVLEQNEDLKEQLKKLKTLLIDKDKENNYLKETLNSSLVVPNNHIEQTKKDKSRMLELEELKEELRNLKQELFDTHEEHAKDINQNKCLQKKMLCTETELDKCLKLYNDDHSQLIEVKTENEYLKCQIEELQQTVEQLNEKNSSIDVQNVSVLEPESASTIIDLQLKEKEEEIYKLTKKLSLLEEKNEKLSEEKVDQIKEIETMKVGLEDNLKCSSFKMKELNEKYLNLQEELNTLKSSLQSSEDENNLLKQRNINLETDVDHLKSQLAESYDKVDVCNVVVLVKEQECAKLLNQIETLETDKRNLQTSIKDKVNQMKEIEIIKVGLEENLKYSSFKMKELNEKYLNLQEELNTLKSSLQSSEDENNLLIQRNINLEADVDHLKNQLAESYDKVDVCNVVVSKKEQECAKLLNQIETLETDKRNLQTSIKDKVNQIKEIETMKVGLEDNLKCCSFKIKDLNENYFNLQEELNTLKSSLQSSEDEKNLLIQKNINLETDVNHLKSQLAESNDKVDVCNVVVLMKEQKCAKLLNQIETLETDKRNLQTSIKDKVNQIKEIETMRIGLEESLESSSLKMKDLNENYLHLQEELNTLNSRLQSSEDEKNLLILRNINLETDVNHLKSQLAESNNKVDLCNVVVSEKEQECAKLLNQIETLETDKRNLLTSINDQVNQIKEIETMKIGLEESLECTSLKMKDLNENCLHLQEELNTLNTRLQSSEDDKNLLILRNINLETDVNHLKSQLAESNNKLDLCNVVVSEREQECAKLLNQIQTLETDKINLQTSMKDKVNQVKEIETMKVDLEENLKYSSIKMKDLNENYLNLQEKLNTLQKSLQSSEDEKNLLIQKNINLETDVNHLKSQLAESNNKVDLCNVVVSEKEQECAKLMNQMETLETDKRNLLTSINDQVNQVKEIETMKVDLEENLKYSSIKMKDLNENYLNLQEKLNTLQSSLQSSEDEKNLLIQKNINLETDVNHLKSQLAESNNKVDLCNVVVSEKEQECAKLMNQMETLETDKRNLLTSINDQVNQIKEIETMKLVLEDNLKCSGLKMKDLNETYLNLQEELNTLKSSLKSSEDEKNLLVQRNIYLETDVNHLKSQLSESNNKVDLCNVVVSEKEKECAKLLYQIETLETDKRHLQTAVQDQIVVFETKMNQLAEEIETKNLTMQSRIVKIILSMECLRNDIIKHVLVEKELNQTIEELNNRVSSLGVKIQSYILLNDENIKTIEDLRQKLNEKTNDLDSALCETQVFKSEIKDLNKRINELSSASQQKSDELLSLNSDIKEKECTLETLKNQLLSLGQLLKIEEEKVIKLNSSKEEMFNTIQILENRCSDIEKEYKMSESKVISLNEEVFLTNDQLVSKNLQLNEAHDQLFNDYHKLSYEHDALIAKYNNLKITNSNTRAEYDEKLKKLKDQMKETCTRAMKQTEENCEMKIKHYKESILSTEEQIRQLSSQLWDTSDKLVVTKKDNEELKSAICQLQRKLVNQNATLAKRRSQSHENLSYGTPEKQLDVDESVHSRRRSVRAVPSGLGIKLLPSGKVFPSEDEAEEMFNNECLADLKAGRCRVSSDPNRVSTLMYRNSLCPPHLKSSYPAETQFLPLGSAHEDEIKGREVEVGDCKSLLSEKRKKERSQTSYKRPGPPTPSKNGGRATLQDQTLDLKQTPRNVLKELNSEQKKVSTPSRLFSNMFSSRHKDENTPTTTNQKKLSFFKSFGKRE